MIKPGTRAFALWNKYTLRIKALQAEGKLMEAAILLDVRSALCEKRPNYMNGWSDDKIEAHYRNFHENIANGTNPYVAEMTYENA